MKEMKGSKLKNTLVTIPHRSVGEEGPDIVWDKKAVPVLSSKSILYSNAQVCSPSVNPGQPMWRMQLVLGHIALVTHKIAVKIIPGHLYVELPADVHYVLFSESGSC